VSTQAIKTIIFNSILYCHNLQQAELWIGE